MTILGNRTVQFNSRFLYWYVRSPIIQEDQSHTHQQLLDDEGRIGMMKTATISTATLIVCWVSPICNAWLSPYVGVRDYRPNTRLSMAGNLHGQNACFVPLEQLDQDYYAPRILQVSFGAIRVRDGCSSIKMIQIAGAYPGITAEEITAVQSEPAPELGQWTYDFSDPDGPQLGTVAIQGSQTVAGAEDPIVIIAEHLSIGVTLPKEIEDSVDLIVLVDRAYKNFEERKFLVVNMPSEGVKIAAFATKSEIPAGTEILGQVLLVQIPWLPAMKPTKTGFMEVDEYF